MRILSQDGMIDAPYEQTVINIDYRNKNNIVADGVNCSDCNPYTVATYSTEAKAKMAMEMLHDAYMAHFMYKTMSEQKKTFFIASVTDKEQKSLFGIFQFPFDEELEG